MQILKIMLDDGKKINKVNQITASKVGIENEYLVFYGEEELRFKLSEEEIKDEYVDSFVDMVNSLTGKLIIWCYLDNTRTAYSGDIVEFEVYENGYLVKGLTVEYLQP